MTLENILPYISLLIAIITIVMNGRKDTRANAAEDARTQAKLDIIGTGVNDIRVDQRAMREKVDVMNERLAKVEASTSSAHKRIDSIEKGGK